MWGGPSHARMHQAENQTRGENQLPWRRGLLGWLIPTVTLTAFAIAVIVYLVVN